jgi:hypothetical protein
VAADAAGILCLKWNVFFSLLCDDDAAVFFSNAIASVIYEINTNNDTNISSNALLASRCRIACQGFFFGDCNMMRRTIVRLWDGAFHSNGYDEITLTIVARRLVLKAWTLIKRKRISCQARRCQIFATRCNLPARQLVKLRLAIFCDASRTAGYHPHGQTSAPIVVFWFLAL